METSNRILFPFFSIASIESGLLLCYFLVKTTRPCSLFFNDQNSHNRPRFFLLKRLSVFFLSCLFSKEEVACKTETLMYLIYLEYNHVLETEPYMFSLESQ